MRRLLTRPVIANLRCCSAVEMPAVSSRPDGRPVGVALICGSGLQVQRGEALGSMAKSSAVNPPGTGGRSGIGLMIAV